MKDFIKKFIFTSTLVFLVLALLVPVFNIFAQNPLEIQYPVIKGFAPKLLDKDLFPKYVNYIFNFIIGISGLIALGALIYAGVLYLTSTGKPDKLKEAQDRLVSVFWGIIILLSSYLILLNINPQLLLLNLPALEKIELPFSLPETPPAAPPDYPNFLWRISEIANTSQLIINDNKTGIKISSENIKSLTGWCDCKNTESMCLCRKYIGGSCQAIYCYSAKPDQPCPNDKEIKENQQNLIASTFEIIYYKNRADAEREDFLLEIENLKKSVAFWADKINAEKEYLAQLKSEGEKENQEIYINFIEDEKTTAEKTLALYNELEKKLKEFSDQVNEFSISAKRLFKLPDGIQEEKILGCLENVKTQCQGSCKGGCHDTKECTPVSCGGGNPCPMGQITSERQKIEGLANQINSVCEEIKNIVNEIIRI